MSREKISIVIPAFNEEPCLQELLCRLDSHIRKDFLDFDVEVLIVDDHSSDKTPQVLRELAVKYPFLSYIRLLKNSGSHIAIFAGLSKCSGDYAFIMGADLQDPPDIIPFFLEQARKGAKVVLGEREKRSDPISKRIFSRIFNFFMSRFVLPNYPANGGDVFLIDRDIINAVLKCAEKNANIFVLILSLCHDVGVVKYSRLERFAGVSKWSFRKLFKLAYDSLITVGYVPLKAIFWAGLGSFLMSLLWISYLVFNKLSGRIEVEGWASTVGLILFFGGMNMLAISILGEYLWRNFDQTRKRPLFILEREHHGRDDSAVQAKSGFG